jgi:1-deoxy-D-xylulose-5-phosphate reductoisomerase
VAKHIAILGSTGSIGRNAIQVIDALGPGYEVFALSAHTNVRLLADQAKQYRPRFVAVTDIDCAQELAGLLSDLDTEILAGPDALATIAELDQVDTILAAVVGAAGLPAILAAARKGKRLAIANKEPLVIAGELLTREIATNGGVILPVHSEHSAVFQAMQSGTRE